jgi:hypothetical protein
MLNPQTLDRYPDKLVELYAEAEADIIADMARRISTYNYFIPAAEWQFKKLQEMGNLHDDILKKLSKKTGKTKIELKALMKEAGATTLKADDAIYRKAGLNPLPISQSQALQTVIETGLNKTSGLFENLTRTTANTATKQFERVADQAYMQITTGALDHNTAIRNAVKNLASKGVEVVKYPTGHANYMDAAVRRAVLTGVNQTALKLQDARADEMGCDLVETSAHAGSRPEHAEWQGKIFSRGGKHPKYPDFISSTGYGTGEGLGGWNCRHSYYPFIEGVSEPIYTKSELSKMEAKDYTYNGEKLTEHEAAQKQRYIERQIRRRKREYKGMEAAGLPTDEAASKIARWQEVQKDFIEQTGLKHQAAREQIAAFGKSEAAKVVAIKRKVNAFNNLTGTVTPNKIIITEISKHFGERAIQRGISHTATHDALTNPLKIGKIRTDGTQQFIGEKATVAVNTSTGKITTVWPTQTKRAAKLKRGDQA